MRGDCESDIESAADIIRMAGGQIVGRTKLQKIAYLLEAIGVGSGFHFEYRHYGPYSEQLANATSSAKALGIIDEAEYSTNWGGWYSVFKTQEKIDAMTPEVAKFIETASTANSVDLELAATAVFLNASGEPDPWGETASRKPEKSKMIESAKQLYARLRTPDVPKPLPDIR